MHSLLARQLKKYFGGAQKAPKELSEFLDAVNDAYEQSDTDRKMLERSFDISSAELMRANTELRISRQASPDIFFRLDKEGRILDYSAGNESDLYRPPKEFMGKRVGDVMPQPVGAKLAGAIEKVLAEKALVTLEYALQIKGIGKYYEARLMPLLNDQVMAIIRDISGRVQAETQIKEKIEELEDFHKVAVGRELKMIELENEVNALLKELGRSPKY
ncbi:MAG TPA: PAS domain-containing protein [Candidatus Omnitrophota bacterium]|nr:PAS domain-containing protein [Candidatus Omnitrophota bacterium]